MHARIDDDIENKECEEIFENEHKQRTKKLRKKIGRCFNECKESFIEEMKKDIEQFEERIKDSLIMLECISIDSGNFDFNFDFNIDFNIDNGIDTIGLFSSIGGLGLLFLMPVVGEFALIAGVVLAFVGIGKSIWSFFDSDYKKSQQKKEVDKNLHQICEKIAEAVKSRIESYKKGASEMIENLKANLRPVDNYKRMKGQLKEAHEKLGYISHNIKTRSMQ